MMTTPSPKYYQWNTSLAMDELRTLGASLIQALGPREADQRLVFTIRTASGETATWIWDDTRFAFFKVRS
jgi:hypothetical protein